MTPKTVLMTTDTIGGVWNYSLQLAKELTERGIKIALASMGKLPTRSQTEAVVKLSQVEFFESSYRLEWMEDPWSDLSAAGVWLLELEQRIRPDIVHLNGYAHGALPWKASVCTVAHSCVLSWWRAVLGESAPGSWSRYRVAVAEGLRLCDHLVAPSAAILKVLRSIYEVLPPASVIHNGVSSAGFRPGKKFPIVFTAGRLWDQAKNIEAVCHCAALLPWQFVIAGEGDPPNPISKNVLLIGNVSSEIIAHYMAIASIYCLPARYEPFGLTILEAALSGCALILGDIEPLRELWDGAAIFVSPNDLPSLARRLKELMENEVLRKTMSELAQQRAKRFSAERMASSYLQLYSRMRDSGRRADPLPLAERKGSF